MRIYSDHFYYFDTHKVCANFGIILNILSMSGLIELKL